MKLGILVNTDRHLEPIRRVTHAALAKGHEVTLFTMDTGTRLLREPRYVELANLPGVTMSFCQESATRANVDIGDIPPAVACGSQVQNAMMAESADRLIVL